MLSLFSCYVPSVYQRRAPRGDQINGGLRKRRANGGYSYGATATGRVYGRGKAKKSAGNFPFCTPPPRLKSSFRSGAERVERGTTPLLNLSNIIFYLCKNLRL